MVRGTSERLSPAGHKTKSSRGMDGSAHTHSTNPMIKPSSSGSLSSLREQEKMIRGTSERLNPSRNKPGSCTHAHSGAHSTDCMVKSSSSESLHNLRKETKMMRGTSERISPSRKPRSSRGMDDSAHTSSSGHSTKHMIKSSSSGSLGNLREQKKMIRGNSERISPSRKHKSSHGMNGSTHTSSSGHSTNRVIKSSSSGSLHNLQKQKHRTHRSSRSPQRPNRRHELDSSDDGNGDTATKSASDQGSTMDAGSQHDKPRRKRSPHRARSSKRVDSKELMAGSSRRHGSKSPRRKPSSTSPLRRTRSFSPAPEPDSRILSAVSATLTGQPVKQIDDVKSTALPGLAPMLTSASSEDGTPVPTVALVAG